MKVSELPILIIVMIVIGIFVVVRKKLCLIARLLIALIMIVMIQIIVVSVMIVVVVVPSLKVLYTFNISDTIMCETFGFGPEFGFSIVVCVIV